MTTNNGNIDLGTLPSGIPAILDMWTRRLYTAMPGEIVSFDMMERRADVKGNLDVVLKDGTQIERPVISNVPVVFPTAKDFLMEFILEPKDPVLLVYSMRGLARWKLAHGRVVPDVDGMMSERDAICIPGFGPVGEHDPAVKITAREDRFTMRLADVDDVEDASQHRVLDFSYDTQRQVPTIHMQVGEDVEIELTDEAVAMAAHDGNTRVICQPNLVLIDVQSTTTQDRAHIEATSIGTVTIQTIGGDIELQAGRYIDFIVPSGREVRINGQRVLTEADTTDSASGPGSHSHGFS